MKTRILAAAALLPLLLIVILVLPSVYTTVLFGVMAAIGAYELLWRTGLAKVPSLVAVTSAFAFLNCLWSGLGHPYVWALAGILVFAAILFGHILASSAKLSFEKICICLAGGLLIPFLFGAIIRLRCMEQGKFYILIPCVLAFLPDTGAYFAGRAFGKHKLSPVISPNKTVEGVVGGVVSAMLGMLLFCLILQLGFSFRVNYGYALLYGALGALAAVFGDLSFSAIKRQTGIKDYGNLIPGHGGILDRFDSMTVVAPLVEVLMLLLPVVVKV